MPGPLKTKNPFYVLLFLMGPAFVVSIAGYVLMMLQLNASRGLALSDSGNQAHPFVAFFREYGNEILGTELILLAICTFGAIATDEWRTNRSTSSESRDQPGKEHESHR